MQNKKIVLISGANKGLGFEAARQICKEGHTVIIGARNLEKGQAAAKILGKEGFSVNSVLLDVTRLDTIHKTSEWIEREYGKLDILVNNAGRIIDEQWLENSVERIPMTKLQETFETNFFGPIELTRALLPLLRKSNGGRIVNVSSIMGSLSLHYTPGSPIFDSKPFAYNASKTALNQFTVHLAHLLKDTSIKVYSAHPGWVKTDLGGDYAPMSVEEGAKTIVDLALDKVEFPSGSFVHMSDQLPW